GSRTASTVIGLGDTSHFLWRRLIASLFFLLVLPVAGAFLAALRVRFFAGADALLQARVGDLHTLLQRFTQVRKQIGAFEKEKGHAGVDCRRNSVAPTDPTAVFFLGRQ